MLLATSGPTAVFVVNAVSFLGVLVAVALLPAARVAAAMSSLGGAIKEGLAYVFGQRSIASLMILTLFAGVFGTPPIAFMLPGIVKFQLDAGPATLGALTACIGLGSLLGSIVMLFLARRVEQGRAGTGRLLPDGHRDLRVGVSTSVPLSLVMAVVGGFCGVVFVGLSTVTVQAMSSDEMRARAMAIWAAAFVGLLPFGALITTALAAWLGAGGAVLVDGLIMFGGGLAVLAVRPELGWLDARRCRRRALPASTPRPSRWRSGRLPDCFDRRVLDCGR